MIVTALIWVNQVFTLDESMIEITATSEGLEKRLAGAIYKEEKCINRDKKSPWLEK